VGDEIDPQFRIASAEGEYWIALTLLDDEAERVRRLALISDFMALKAILELGQSKSLPRGGGL
jgi:hypothetical protein